MPGPHHLYWLLCFAFLLLCFAHKCAMLVKDGLPKPRKQAGRQAGKQAGRVLASPLKEAQIGDCLGVWSSAIIVSIDKAKRKISLLMFHIGEEYCSFGCLMKAPIAEIVIWSSTLPFPSTSHSPTDPPTSALAFTKPLWLCYVWTHNWSEYQGSTFVVSPPPIWFPPLLRLTTLCKWVKDLCLGWFFILMKNLLFRFRVLLFKLEQFRFFFFWFYAWKGLPSFQV